MDLFLSMITFVLGFLAEKLLDYIMAFLGKKMKKKKLETTLENFYTKPHQDIVITASGFPYFSFDSIQESISSNKKLLLTTPKEVTIDDNSNFSNKDILRDDFRKFISENELETQLETIREQVFASFLKKENGNYFNGKILGVNRLDGLSRTNDINEAPILSIDFFETDYYTHKIVEKLIQNLTFKKESLVKDLNSSYSWSRSSFGVSLILILPKQNEIILTKRSSRASYTGGKEWIYVSVTETLSETDFDEETRSPDLLKCVWRGIREELGLSDRQLKKDTLKFYESFYETHFKQDNIVASVEISEDLTFSEIYSLLAKDKFLEISDIITIPNDKKAISNFIEDNRSKMRAQTIFSLESFNARK